MFRFLIALIATVLIAQQPPPSDPTPPVQAAAEGPDVEFVCPMDPDVRSKEPGKCPRCGMKLVAGIPDPHEYPVRISTKPRPPKAGAPVDLTFRIDDPKGKPVRDFEIVHEKLFHLFIISQDLTTFAHEHPVRQPDSTFQYRFTFPKPGLYRVLSDFYPKDGTPQLMANSLLIPGAGFKVETAKPAADLSPKHAENIDVDLVMEPEQPISGQKTLMFFRIKPNDGIEQYLGAWGHMMAASWDLIDMIHQHPFLVTDPEGYKQIQFNMIFPREGVYRVWVQFQRKGVVNTVAFNVPVAVLK
ncbi:MAG TPA: heavy metal-binding domain-containing protein [Bryobacteraceae bacterium]|jgi:hypothetical protein|nr:heavy metal-binding domain-containing protein [Bryobacteraceae bacterium]